MKKFYCSVLKSSRDMLQEYAMKNRGFYLKNSMWHCSDLGNAIQGQTDQITE